MRMIRNHMMGIRDTEFNAVGRRIVENNAKNLVNVFGFCHMYLM